MKQLVNVILLGSFLFLGSCFEAEEFPLEPNIAFESLRYVDLDAGLDSLVLTFTFEDGDGNLGLGDNINDRYFPYHDYSFIIDEDDTIVTIGYENITFPLYELPILIDVGPDGFIQSFYDYSLKSEFSNVDNRPLYDCENYEIIESDTVYVVRNEQHHNFHVEFRKKVNGVYSVIDFQQIFNSDDCDLGNFNGRFPIWDTSGKEGTITYAMLSQVFRLALLDDTTQLRFWIYDRDLNRSNTVETPDFVLSELPQ